MAYPDAPCITTYKAHSLVALPSSGNETVAFRQNPQNQLAYASERLSSLDAESLNPLDIAR